ncbi:MAG TPA: alpha/beta hydrolase [Chitinophagales bacterium]|jgi:pimeloyl-ACP methyl ester carboxylesterase|nr:alpha/beta hydrolase [Chitinophagales bacterium]HNL06212.1 alpha/beta hydrolase [Chitinophagales bacterium]
MQIYEVGKFQYLAEGQGEILLLLHGLFGALSNFNDLIQHFKDSYQVVVPLLPLYTLPAKSCDLEHLTAFVHDFIAHQQYDKVILLGNSLGGHIALKYTVEHQERVKALVLTGSSGLFENAMGDTYPRRGDREYIRKKTEITFYDPAMATEDLVDEVFDIVTKREKVINVLAIAKSAIRNNMKEELPNIKIPVMLIWGQQDQITPPFVAEEFHATLPNSQLAFIDQCGHAPMMERPAIFNELLDNFLRQLPTEA